MTKLTLQDIKEQFRIGNHQQAIELCQQFIKNSPKDFEALKLLGKMHGLTGDNKSAISINKKIYREIPNDSEVIFNLAYLERECLHFVEAQKWLKIFLKLHPEAFEGWALLVDLELKLGNPEIALANSEIALNLSKDDLSVRFSRARCYRYLKKPEKAIEELDIASQFNETSIEVNYEYGENYLLLNNKQKAERHYLHVLHAEAKSLEDVFLKTRVNLYFNDYASTFSGYKLLIENQFKLVEILNLKARLLIKLKRYGEAENVLLQASVLDGADVWFNLGILYSEIKLYQKSNTNFEKFMHLDGSHADALTHMAINFWRLGQPLQSISCCKKALQLDPQWPKILSLMVQQLNINCDWSEYKKLKELLLNEIQNNNLVTIPFVALSLFDDANVQLSVAKTFVEYENAKSKLLNPVFQPKKTNTKTKIKIGYFSPDLGDHAVSKLAVEFFELHDRSQFEIFGFSFLNLKSTEFKTRVTNSFDHFIDVSLKSNEEVIQIVQQLEIEVAIDLCGLTAENRHNLFQSRVAPIQINYLGYPGTTSIKNMDYILADKVIIPPENQKFYSEKIIYLPDCYQCNDRKRKVSDKEFTRKELGLPENDFIYCCFNNQYKITPDTFDVWMEILKSAANSSLWLFMDNPEAQENLRQEAANRGVNPNRIIFAFPMEHSEHLKRLSSADLFLDTLPYNAHTTASDALWVGVPVLTLQGNAFPARVASSLLHAIDLSELITNSYQEYQQLAIDYALNPEKLISIKEKLATNISIKPLFDTPEFTKNVEKAYQTIYQRYVDNQPVEHIYL